MSKRMSHNTDPRSPSDRGHLGGMRYFGPKVRELREGYLSRLAEGSNAALLGGKAGLTASAVVDCLRNAGYELSLPSYSEIESGANMPRDAARFLTIIEQCLSLKSEEKRDLEHRLAYDILYARLGERTDPVLQPPERPALEQGHPTMLGLVLRDLRMSAHLSLEDLAQTLFEHGVTLNVRELRVLERLKLSPTTYLAGQLGEFEQSDLHAPWPFELEPPEFIAKVAQCLPTYLQTEQRLAHALTLDELARQASAAAGPAKSQK